MRFSKKAKHLKKITPTLWIKKTTKSVKPKVKGKTYIV